MLLTSTEMEAGAKDKYTLVIRVKNYITKRYLRVLFIYVQSVLEQSTSVLEGYINSIGTLISQNKVCICREKEKGCLHKRRKAHDDYIL